VGVGGRGGRGVEVAKFSIRNESLFFNEKKQVGWFGLEMQRTGRGGLDGLKNRSGKCEGPMRRRGGPTVV